MSMKNNGQSASYNRLALIGFDSANQAMMEYCFAKAADCELVDAERADIILINGDRPESAEQQQANINKTFPEQHKIVISLYELKWPGFSLLQKPHSPDDLLNLIRSIKNGGACEGIVPLASQSTAQVIRQRQGQPLKQKLIRGKLIVNAADRLVKQIEDELKAKKAAEKERNKTAAERKKDNDKKKKAEAKVKKLERKLELMHASTAPSKPEPPKPLTPEQVLQCCGNQPDLDVSKPDNRRLLYVSGEGLLLTQLLGAKDEAMKKKCVVEINGLPGPFYLCPAKQIIYSWFDDDFLNQLSLTRFSFGELQVHPLEVEEESFTPDKELRAMPADAFIWKVAVWTARGRLLMGMDPDKAYQLQHKPDFTQLINLPHSEEITFLWNGHNLSAQDVMHILDIPQREVFSFMTGAYVLGWLE